MANNVFRLMPDGDPTTGMGPSDMIDASAFTTSDHSETNHTFFQTDDNSILSGVWECAPCREDIEAYPVHEMMTVISGSVTMTNADGSSDTFTAPPTKISSPIIRLDAVVNIPVSLYTAHQNSLFLELIVKNT